MPHKASASFTVTPIDDTTQMTDAITNYTLLAQYTPYTGTTPHQHLSAKLQLQQHPMKRLQRRPTLKAPAQNKISSTTLSEILVAIGVVVVLGVLVAVSWLEDNEDSAI